MGVRRTKVATAPDPGEPETVAQQLGAELCTDPSAPRPAQGLLALPSAGLGATGVARLTGAGQGRQKEARMLSESSQEICEEGYSESWGGARAEAWGVGGGKWAEPVSGVNLPSWIGVLQLTVLLKELEGFWGLGTCRNLCRSSNCASGRTVNKRTKDVWE